MCYREPLTRRDVLEGMGSLIAYAAFFVISLAATAIWW